MTSRLANLETQDCVEGSAESAASSPRGATDPVARNVRAIAHLTQSSALRRSAFAHVCDRVTYSAGTTWSLVLHGAWFVGWIALNSLTGKPFDPFPFSLLTSMVSLEAIFLTLFVLSSQNHFTQESDQRAQLDLQVNLLAEQEMTLVLRMLRDLCQRAGIPLPEELSDVVADVDIERVAATVAEELSPGAS